MLGKYKNIFKLVFSLKRIEKKTDDLLLLTAQSTIRENNKLEDFRSLHEVEFKVYSQWGDDGIIQYLIHKLQLTNKTFIEFGVENYRESNTRFLLINNNWRGLVFDGSEKHIDTIQQDDIYWRHDITAKHAFITRDNINGLLTENYFTGPVGLLHIDIDGNDYWVWEAINVVTPDIVIMEYNALFGKEKAVTIPYQADFTVGKAHYSRLYFGASLKSLVTLAKQKGYFFVGCNSAGVNAYFISNKFKGVVREVTLDEGYVMSSTRQARDANGNLSFLSGTAGAGLLKGLEVYNVETGNKEPF